jgi:hypothetical protein
VAVQTIRANIDLLGYLPDPPEKFHAFDLPKSKHGVLRRMDEDGIIEKVGKESYDHLENTHNDRWAYRIEPWVVEKVRDILNHRDSVCPCGHAGVHNCGDHFECTFDLCDQEFDREELEVA